MQTAIISLVVSITALAQASSPSPIPKQEMEYQQQAFQQWWGQPLVVKLDDLPTDGSVPDFRIPYSGFDYPDRAGGTVNAMSKYDRAFNNGRGLATEYERKDVEVHRPGLLPGTRVRLFARLRAARGPNTPTWYGHCNGWTAAAIRHAEPQYSVRRNGVVFTPADIKGLLAEIYMYTDTEFLGGVDAVIHPAVFHLSLTNWLGRGAHPIGMEAAVGEVVINYPIYSYKSKVTSRQDREMEVTTNITYAMNTNFESNQSQRFSKQMYFHYLLDLDDEGNIIGGRYYTDSARVDMLWAPLQPIQGGQKGNERGNPHVNVKEVLAIWRESVPEELRQKWLNIDPTDEDRVVTADESAESTAEAAKPESSEKPAAPEKPADADESESPKPATSDAPPAGADNAEGSAPAGTP